MEQLELVRAFSQRLLRAQDEERRRIARELHDSSGQLLSALGMGLSLMVQQLKREGSDLANIAEESDRMVQQLTREIRTTSYLLHPPLLDDIGLPEALKWYVDGLRSRSGLEIKLTISDDFGRLSRELELALFRLVQELLNEHSPSQWKQDGESYLL